MFFLSNLDFSKDKKVTSVNDKVTSANDEFTIEASETKTIYFFDSGTLF